MSINCIKNTILPDITQQQQYNADNLATAQKISNLRTQEYWQKRGIDLSYQLQKNMNQLYYQRGISAIQVEETAQKAKVRADISLEKGLKQLQVIVLADGRLKLEQQCFGEPLQNILSFRIKSCKRYVPIFGGPPGVLYVNFEMERNSEKLFWLNLARVTSRTVNTKFTALGLSFGLSGQKEAQLRQLFIERAIRLAEEIGLPQAHGWYCLGGELQFAFPEELTWEEVTAYAM